MRLIVLVALFLMTSVAWTQKSVLKCVAPDGSVSFQQTECPGTASKAKVELREADYSSNRVGMALVQAIAKEYPEILESQEATDSVVARRDELIASGVPPEAALRMAAAELAARHRGGAGSVAKNNLHPGQANTTSMPNMPRPEPDPSSGYVLCTQADGTSYMSPSPCPPSTSRMQSHAVEVIDPRNGQISRGHVNLPEHEPVRQQELSQAEFCAEEKKRRFNRSRQEAGPDVYDRNKARLLHGKWICD